MPQYRDTYSLQPAMLPNEELIHYLLPLNTNQEVIEQLYACFSRKDYRGMAACYHPEAAFSDGVFEVKGKQIAAMWHLLCESAKGFSVQTYQWYADGDHGTAGWEATYPFFRTGRQLYQLFHAKFEFREGKIIRHQETSPFWRWASRVLGWTSGVGKPMHKAAATNLRKFLNKHPQYN